MTIILNFRMPNGVQGTSQGAGVAIAADKVLTCKHLWSLLPPGTQFAPASVLADSAWGDDATGTRSAHAALPNVQLSPQFDLALLVVPGLSATPVALGRDDEVLTGDDVFFVGHPFFEENSQAVVSTAVVSAKVVEDGRHLFVLDGAANHGNSGGALFSRDSGKLIGIVIAKRGRIDENLRELADPSLTGGAGVIAGNVDVVKLLQATVLEMAKNTQLGVSVAVRIQDIATFLKAADPQDFERR